MTTVTGLFDNPADAESAVQELVQGGWPREDIGVVTSHTAVGETHKAAHLAVKDAEKGAIVGGLAGLFLGLTELAIPGVGLVLVGGWLAVTLIGAGVGAATGGLAGALVEAGVSHAEAGHLAEGIRKGGTLVTLQSATERVTAAEDVLRRHHAVNVQDSIAQSQSNG